MILPLLVLGATPAVTVDETTFDGEPAYRLTNAAAQVVVSPALGRVVEYRLKDGPNVLYNVKAGPGPDGYRNVGGDMVWYAPRPTGTALPDPSWDGAPMKAETLPDGVRLTSERGKRSPLRLRREIRLDAYGSKVTFRNSLTNEGGVPSRSGLWQITQLARPAEIRLSALATTAQPDGYAVLQGRRDARTVERRGDLLVVRPGSAALRIGSGGRDASVAADVGTYRFTSASALVRGATYPERGSARIVYLAPTGVGLGRIEHLAPLETLDPRQVQQQTVVWTLTTISQ